LGITGHGMLNVFTIKLIAARAIFYWARGLIGL
jgi:hypothetical protein